MAFDLTDEELQATREMNKTACNNKVEKFKISVPLYTNQELSEMENIIQNDFESIFDKVNKQVYHDRELIILQKIIKKQQKENGELLSLLNEIREILNKYKYTELGNDGEIINFYKELQRLIEERND